MTALVSDARPVERARPPAVDLSVAFAGGGTGGHIAPALALAERVAADGGRVVFLSTDRVAERAMIDGAGFERRILPLTPSPRRPRFLYDLVRSVAAARDHLTAVGAGVVVGLGGLGSLPGVVAARLERLPVVLLEQNAIPGRANRWLARLADSIDCQFEAAAVALGGRFVGSPVRRRIVPGDRRAARRALGLDPDRATVLVVGGSQGARGLNDVVAAAREGLEGLADVLQLIHISGERDLPAMQGAYLGSSLSRFFCPFLHEIETAYQAADLVVCRAGATTLAELAATGKPALLVPYPHAADDHQSANAAAQAAAGAALVVAEGDLDAGRLVRLVGSLASDPARLAAMGEAARALRPACQDATYRQLIELGRR